ncbi:MAG: hypothetical protein IKU88_02290 [Alistipes sp.]|nr:hypothetical protein [Alistipes sp.]
MASLNPIRNLLVMSAVAITILIITACGLQTKDSAQKQISALDRKAEKLKRQIRNTPSAINLDERGAIYYISTEGDDSNSGLSPEQAIRSLEKLNSLELKPNDCVLFRRGDLWRGRLRAKTGVSYSAYGKGEKPRIYGSPYDAAKVGRWVETEAKNIYMYDGELSSDIGTLVFNHGEANAFKVMMIRQEDGSTLHIETREPFASYRDLKRDLEFYHDYKGAKRVYLYSAEGNPAERFSSIELSPRGNIIQATHDTTFDNLCIKYGGSHGIGGGTTNNLTITNCELGWIGGSIQADDIFGRNHPTRFGNAIEIYGGCDNFRVENCYIYQVYDAAITHQHQGDTEHPLTMSNILYANNLIEDCVYSIEYFLGRDNTIQTHLMENILIKGNIMRRAGYGWGKQRPDKECPAHIKSWDHHTNNARNFLIKNNTFDRCTHNLLNIAARRKESLPTMQSNTYIQPRGAMAGSMGHEAKKYTFDESTQGVLSELFGENAATIIFVEE